MKPGPAIMELHGKQGLAKRMAVFDEFAKKERAAALFCTDIAARGVDFPAVDWVVQLDCPENTDSYIHRVGRTARYQSGGSALLLLSKSEESFVEKLQNSKIELSHIYPKTNKVQSIQGQLQSLLASDPPIRHLATKSFCSYARSVSLMKDRSVFKIKELDLEAFAQSLGLAAAPEVNLGGGLIEDDTDTLNNPLKTKKNQSALQRLKEKIKMKREQKKAQEAQISAKSGQNGAMHNDSEEESELEPENVKSGRWERRQRQRARLDAARTEVAPPKNASAEEDLLQPVSKTASAALEAELDDRRPAKPKKLKLGRDGVAKNAKGKHTIFAEGGTGAFAAVAEDMGQSSGEEELAVKTSANRAKFLESVRNRLAEADADDTAVSRARIKEKHQKKRQREKQERRNETGDVIDEPMAVLGGASDDESQDRSIDEEAQSDASESSEEPVAPASKKLKNSQVTGQKKQMKSQKSAPDDIEALEAQALKALGGLFS